MLSLLGRIRLGRGINMVADISPDFGRYYRSLMPKYIYINSPMYPSHITIIRSFKEIPNNFEKWFDFQGQDVIIKYDPYIYEDQVYFYVNAWSDDIAEIRRLLGLPKYRYNEFSSYHITIGNKKCKQ